MRYTIPIIPEIVIENVKKMHQHYSCKNRPGAFWWMFVCVMICLLAIGLPFNDVIRAVIVTISILGILVLTSLFFILPQWQRRKILSETADLYGQVGEMTIEFTPEYLWYADHVFDTKVQWHVLKGYVIIDGTLYIVADNEGGFMISKKVVSEKEFDEMVAFTREKLPLIKR